MTDPYGRGHPGTTPKRRRLDVGALAARAVVWLLLAALKWAPAVAVWMAVQLPESEPHRKDLIGGAVVIWGALWAFLTIVELIPMPFRAIAWVVKRVASAYQRSVWRHE